MRPPRLHFNLLLPLAAALAAMALVGAIALGGSAPRRATPPQRAGTPSRAEHAGRDHAVGDAAHTKLAFVRDLTVYTEREPEPSAAARRMRALLTAGTLPKEVVSATVLSDEDCAPDHHGVSHCRNTLQLPSGRTITVRHPHRMMDVPCMTPGEKVRIDDGVSA